MSRVILRHRNGIVEERRVPLHAAFRVHNMDSRPACTRIATKSIQTFVDHHLLGWSDVDTLTALTHTGR